MKRESRMEWTSETGFRYEFIVSADEKFFTVFFCFANDEDTGYIFPTESYKIKWDNFPNHAALIGDDVKKVAQSFFKSSRLKTFW
jgi:hypothetical protein